MNQQAATVPPLPVDVLPVPVARPIAMPPHVSGSQAAYLPQRRRTDKLAIGSAVCGVVAVVPVVCQVLGLAFGIAGLIRIRRARRQGIALGGVGWAVVGICSSLLAIVSWIAAATALSAVGASLSTTNEALRALGPLGG